MRQALSGFPAAAASHAGQLLGPLFDGSEKEKRIDFLESACSIKPGPAYAAAFARWQAATQPAITATTTGPLAIGLGNASPTEVGLTLHRTYGLPYLPGSALKGLARRAAREHDLDERAQEVLFGTTGNAAHLIWWDGWLDPDCQAPLQLDTITVHHQKYYGQKHDRPFPTDFDDPNPVAFLSVPPGTKFHLALGGPPGWVYLAAQLLDYGLTQLGLGGKTNAGYGSFDVKLPEKPKTPEELKAEEAAKAQAEAEKLTTRIREDLKNARAIRENAARVLKQISELPSALRVGAVKAVIEQATKFGEKDLAKQVRKLLEGEA